MTVYGSSDASINAMVIPINKISTNNLEFKVSFLSLYGKDNTVLLL